MSEYVCVFKFECACVRACVCLYALSLSVHVVCARVRLSLSLHVVCVCVRASLSLHVVCVVRCVSALVIMGAYVSANVGDWVGQ